MVRWSGNIWLQTSREVAGGALTRWCGRCRWRGRGLGHVLKERAQAVSKSYVSLLSDFVVGIVIRVVGLFVQPCARR